MSKINLSFAYFDIDSQLGVGADWGDARHAVRIHIKKPGKATIDEKVFAIKELLKRRERWEAENSD